MHLDPALWTFFGSCVTALGGITAGGVHFNRRSRRMEQATKQLLPNHGSHLADLVQRIDGKQDAQCELLSAVQASLEQHLRDTDHLIEEWFAWRRELERSLRK